MALPLALVHHATLNSLPSQVIQDKGSTTTTTTTITTADTVPFALHTAAMDASSDSSSPFVAKPDDTLTFHSRPHRSSLGTGTISQENVSPHATASPATSKPAVATAHTAGGTPPIKPVRPGSRIMSGSELSPLKILQGRVTGGGPSSNGNGTIAASPASPDSSADSYGRRDASSATSGVGDDQASSTASSPPPPQPSLSTSSTLTTTATATATYNPMPPPAVPLGRTPRKVTGLEKRFPVKISVPPAAAMGAAPAANAAASPATPATPVAHAAVAAVSGSLSPRLVEPQQQQRQQQQQQQQAHGVPPHSPSQQSQALFASIQKQPPLHGRQLSLDEAIQLNEGLKQAIEIFEDETSVIENATGDDHSHGHGSSSSSSSSSARKQQSNGSSSRPSRRGSLMNGRVVEYLAQADGAFEDLAGPDDTMISTFSTFSAVPMASRTGTNSPSKAALPPHASAGRANGATGSVPNRNGHYEAGGNTTSLLMDFTEQLRFAQQQQQQQKQSLDANGGASVAATPQRKSLVNLLDFEIPPLPTPRSIPSVTPRELESLKSNFLSEISSLKASLSGKEAEAQALKTAVGDAEKRVGECQEQLREDRAAREQLTEEKGQWERRAREMEEVLRKVKGEIVLSQRDREELEAKLDESEKRREAAEMMAQEAESKMAAMRAGRATAESAGAAAAAAAAAATATSGSSGATASVVTVQREVEIAVERVARELHAAYKAKHEAKVTALKKSYEARWEKRVRELEVATEGLAEENRQLRSAHDATRVKEATTLQSAANEEERRVREARDAAQIKELGAEVDKLEAVVRTVQADNAELRTLLEQERVEKGELVILAEEMMAMQQQSFLATTTTTTTPRAGGARSTTTSTGRAPSRGPIESPRKMVPRTPGTGSRTSFSGLPATTPGTTTTTTATPGGGRARPMSMHGTGRISGLKPPSSSTMTTGGAPSRIGRLGHERTQGSVSGGIPRPGSGLGTRSGLMSSIERMGSYRGRGE